MDYKLTPDQRKLIYDVLYAEAGGGPTEEKIAVISTIFNRLDSPAFPNKLEDVLKGYSSYSTESPQYKKAKTGKLNTFERKVYKQNRELVDQIIDYRIERIPEITHFENVDSFGSPDWIGDVDEVGKFGRQVFFKPKGRKEKPEARAKPRPVPPTSLMNVPTGPIMRDYLPIYDPAQLKREQIRREYFKPLFNPDEYYNIPFPMRNPQWGGTKLV